MPRYKATEDTYVDRVLHRAGSEFITEQEPSITWIALDVAEGGKTPSAPSKPQEQGMSYEAIKARLTELGIPFKTNDPKRVLLKLLPEPETFVEAAARQRAIDGGME